MRYELSKYGSVSRSTTYNVIKRLEEMDPVSVISNDPEKYLPFSPEDFIELLKNRDPRRLTDCYTARESTDNLLNPKSIGFNVSYTAGSEWLEYQVDVQEAGPYLVDLRVASDSSEGNCYFTTSWTGAGSNSVFYGGFFDNLKSLSQ